MKKKHLWKTLGVATLLIATMLPMVSLDTPEADAANYCRTLTTTQNGRGGVTGSVLARHKQQSQWCYNGSDVYSGAITLHEAYAVGWTQLAMTVAKDGSSANKIGSSRVHTTYAYAKACLTGPLNFICSRSDANIQQTLKRDGSWSRTSTNWSV